MDDPTDVMSLMPEDGDVGYPRVRSSSSQGSYVVVRQVGESEHEGVPFVDFERFWPDQGVQPQRIFRVRLSTFHQRFELEKEIQAEVLGEDA